MALTNCPECRREVSDKAPACPQCGYPIAERSKRPKDPDVLHVKHDDRSGFTKGVERGMEKVGNETAKGFVSLGIAIVILIVICMAMAVRSSLVCPECNGKGTSYMFLSCEKCDGTGWKK